MAVEDHWGPFMMASITWVLQFSPWQMFEPFAGWSDTRNRGVTHVTAGSFPAAASAANASTGWTCWVQASLSHVLAFSFDGFVGVPPGPRITFPDCAAIRYRWFGSEGP